MKRFTFLLTVVVAVLFSSLSVQAASSWYLPEGSTDGFDLWVLVTNPNSSSAEVTFTFYRAGGSSVTQTATVDANSRYSLNVNNVADIGDYAISTKVLCTNGLSIYAERAMYWSTSNFPNWEGGHTARGISGSEGCYNEIFQPSTFPLTISRSGSYLFVENIINTDEDNHAIEIAASDVTIDLNGFTLTGAGYNEGTKNGIRVVNQSNIVIKNGNIRQFAGDGVSISYDTEESDGSENVFINNINFYDNGDWGVETSAYCSGQIERCNFYYNGRREADVSGAIYVRNGFIVRENNCYTNSGFGIRATDNSIIESNLVTGTQKHADDTYGIGIDVAGTDNRVVGNHSVSNGSYAIDLDGATDTLCIYNSIDNAVNEPGANHVTLADQANQVL